MKKKIVGFLAVLAIAVVAAFNVNINVQEEGTSSISLENVEALASESSSKGTLYGNAAGTKFCCKSGSNSCSSSPC